MFDFNTRIWLCGTLVEVCVEYEVDDGIIEVVKANVIGVYHRGDHPSKQDYTALGCDLPLWASEMQPGLYDELVMRSDCDLQDRASENSREEI